MTSETSTETGPAEFQKDLRLTSDRLMATLDELVELEAAKRSMLPGSDEFVDLAKRIEDLAESALVHTRRQGDLAEDSREAVGTDAEAEHTIDQTPPRAMEVILGEWRAAERRLQESETGSTDSFLAEAEVRRLRDEYRQAQIAARDSKPGD